MRRSRSSAGFGAELEMIMEKTCTYESSHHHTPYKETGLTLAEAIRSAAVDLEIGEAWPVRITSGDLVIWEQSGPLTTRGTLESLALKHSVEWPDL